MMNQAVDVGSIAVAGAMIIPIVAIICAALNRMRSNELQAGLRQEELQLKREMVQKGMSADEIVRVLSAHSDRPVEETRYSQQRQQQWQS
jgi:hypothetical protein